jgi:hypothetical protein
VNKCDKPYSGFENKFNSLKNYVNTEDIMKISARDSINLESLIFKLRELREQLNEEE